MKKLATYIVAAAGLVATPAFATDIPVKAPPPPPPVYTWTGWYVGGNLGYSWARAREDLNYFAPFDSTAPSARACSGPLTFATAICINGSDTANMNGVIGGAQAGYNWQNGNYLLGVEADFQGSGQRGTGDFAASFNNGAVVFPPGGGFVTGNTASTSTTERMPWFGTVRGRVGYVANQWLFYATGGVAYGRIEIDSSASATAIPILSTPTCSSSAAFAATACPLWGFSDSGVTRIGWTVGGGAELALGGNWTAKFEYLFVDLGSFDTTFTGLSACFGVAAGGSAACNVNVAGKGTIHGTITDNVLRVGLNYHFRGPVVARY